MQLFKKIPFRHDEEYYEIRIYYEENIVTISTFLNNYPANGFRYQVQLQKNLEIDKILVEENFNHFINIAKTDIVENRWQKFSNLLR